MANGHEPSRSDRGAYGAGRSARSRNLCVGENAVERKQRRRNVTRRPDEPTPTGASGTATGQFEQRNKAGGARPYSAPGGYRR